MLGRNFLALAAVLTLTTPVAVALALPDDVGLATPAAADGTPVETPTVLDPPQTAVSTPLGAGADGGPTETLAHDALDAPKAAPGGGPDGVPEVNGDDPGDILGDVAAEENDDRRRGRGGDGGTSGDADAGAGAGLGDAADTLDVEGAPSTVTGDGTDTPAADASRDDAAPPPAATFVGAPAEERGRPSPLAVAAFGSVGLAGAGAIGWAYWRKSRM